MNSTNQKLLDFISSCPSPFHTVEALKSNLLSAGYTELFECKEWDLVPGGRYFVTRNQSSLIAFALPTTAPASFMIAAAHSDSPTFKIKEIPDCEVAGGYTRINLEKYGGMLCATWLDRPLSAAGRVTYRQGDGINVKIVDLDSDLFRIPSLAIHMNRSANEGATYNAATDMQAICGSASSKGGYKKLLAEACGCNEDDLLSSDMFLYSRERGCVWGIDNEFISSPRLDDLQCVFALSEGFLASSVQGSVPVLCVFDNEEVGSQTKQGAASTFLEDTLERINESYGGTRSTLLNALGSSLFVSADNAHAVHPNHPELADPVHRPYMNKGIVIKYNANQRYTTDAISSSLFTLLCKKAGVPYQFYTNRPDIPGGSTLGSIANTKVSVNTVDIGLPQLSMHSCSECAGALDTKYLIDAAKLFFSSKILTDGTKYTIE